MRHVSTTLIVSALLAACGGDDSGNGGGAGMGGNVVADYAAVSAILGGMEQPGAGSCAFATSCHGGTGPGKAGLNFKTVADLRDVLVDVPACENSSMMRVAPGDPDNSWLWIKLSADIKDEKTGLIEHEGTPSSCSGVSLGFGTRMPQVAGYAKLPDEKLAVIKAWIEAGAPGAE